MTNLSKALLAATSFSLGVFTGYFITKKTLGENYQFDVQQLKDFYQKRLDELGVMGSEFELDDDEDEEEDDGGYEEYFGKADDEMSDNIKRYVDKRREDAVSKENAPKKAVRFDYTKPSLESIANKVYPDGVSIIPSDNGPEEDEDWEGEDDPSEGQTDAEYQEELERMADEYVRRRQENEARGEPYLIEPEEYREGVPAGYDRQTLYYYTEDRVLCEDDDQEVEDEEDCVGFDYEDKLDMQSTCWVRNDRLGVLYEIHRIKDSYKRAVLGIVETPREREYRIQGRRKAAMDD